MGVARAGGGGVGVDRVSILQDEKVLEMGGGGSGTTVCVNCV